MYCLERSWNFQLRHWNSILENLTHNLSRYQELGYSIVSCALEDYFDDGTDDDEKDSILDFLSSTYADILSNGLAKHAFLKILDDEAGMRQRVRKIVVEEVNNLDEYKPSCAAISYCSAIKPNQKVVDLSQNIVGTFFSIINNVVTIQKDNINISVKPDDILTAEDWLASLPSI